MAMMKVLFEKVEEIVKAMADSYSQHNLDWDDVYPSDETAITVVSGLELRVIFPWLYEELVEHGDTKYWYLDSWTATSDDVEAVASSFNSEAQYELWTRTECCGGSESYSWGVRRIS